MPANSPRWSTAIRCSRDEAAERSLSQFVTGVATDGGFALLVAVDTPLHLQRLLKGNHLLRGDIAVTAGTLDLRRRVRAVAEEHKIRQLVDKLQRDLSVGQLRVTGFA